MGRGCGVTSFDIVECPEGRERHAADRQVAEAARLRARMGDARLVAFDERGTSLTSERLAERIGRWRDDAASVAFVIGGPDGLHDDVRRRADLVLSFGALTLPHQLVRILAVEQFYRALTILSGHPYHRGVVGQD